jgi:hypothetical protein
MAIEKGVYAAPEGIDSIDLEDELDGELVESELEIEIVDPEMVTLSDGSMEITIIPGLEDEDMMDFDSNLVDFLDEGLLNELSDELISMVDSDVVA